MEILNNREISVLIWLLIAFAWAAQSEGIRRSLSSLFKVVAAAQILTLVSLIVVYVTSAVILIWVLGIWTVDHLKSTVVWFLTAGLVSAYRVGLSEHKNGFLRSWLKENLRILLIIEFLVNFRTLSLLWEIVLVPISTLLVATQTYAEGKRDYKQVEHILDWTLAALGVLLIIHATTVVWEEPSKFFTLANLRDFIVPPALSMLYIPFLAGLNIFSSYQRSHRRLAYVLTDPELRGEAQLRARKAFKLDLESLRRWSRNITTAQIENVSDVDRTIAIVKRQRQLERNPTEVPPELGWSPYAAKDFLVEIGLVADDYHPQYEYWTAVSNYLDLSEGVLPDNLVYSLYGDEFAVTHMRLRLTASRDNVSEQSSLEAFQNAVEILLQNALLNISERSEGLLQDTISLIPGIPIRIGPVQVELLTEDGDRSFEHWLIVRHNNDKSEDHIGTPGN